MVADLSDSIYSGGPFVMVAACVSNNLDEKLREYRDVLVLRSFLLVYVYRVGNNGAKSFIPNSSFLSKIM